MSYQLELRHLRYFLAVAEDLHFRQAAERLFISQPGLSKQIRELEEGIGIRLFERSSRKVELTQAGAYLKGALALHLHGLEAILDHARHLHAGLRGELRLGYVGSAMSEVIPRLLLAFRQNHPDILFSLKEMENQAQIDALLAHELDLGFVRLERVPRGLLTHCVLEEPFCLVLPQDHPVNADNFRGLAQLKEAPFILFDLDYSPSYFEKVMQLFDDSGFIPKVTHHTIHSNSIYKLVENHFGLSIVPRSLQQPHLPGVKFIELSHLPQRTVLTAVWPAENRNPVLGDFLGEVRG